jgi:hypothetical protein
MDRNGSAHDRQARNIPWRVGDGDKKQDDHLSNEHKPVFHVRTADIL